MTLDRFPWWLGAALATLTVAVLVGAPAVRLISEAGALPWSELTQNPWLTRVLRFSLIQAALSTVLAIAVAIPVATALHHERRFAGRHALITLFGLSLVLPSIAAVFGLIAIWGSAGWINQLLTASNTSLRIPVLYGLFGILLAHVFFNAPLMTRVMLQALDRIPNNEWRLAAQLGLPASTRFRRLEWPVIARLLPGLATLVFTLCFTSFAVVLALGGGPRATTLEVAIYQALRFDFDLPLAVALAMVQLVVCLTLTLMGGLFGKGNDTGLGLAGDDAHHQAWPQWHPHTQRSASHRWMDRTLILTMAALVVPPIVALTASGFNPKMPTVLTDSTTLSALLNTLFAAFSAAAITLILALCLLSGVRHLHVRFAQARTGNLLQMVGNAILVLPPVVLGTGLFLLLRDHVNVFSLALVLVILVNALMGLPFALRLLAGPVLDGAAARDRLANSIGMPRWTRWRYVDLPLLRRPIAQATAVSATLAAGDLGAIALFGSEGMQTLPLLLHTRLGSHRLDEAATTASLLVTTCLMIYLITVRLIGGKTESTS
jgi:thiamine transport system permease protein